MLEELEKFIGREWNEDLVEDIICAFGTEEEVVVKDSENNGYDKIAYINCPDSTNYCFILENNIVKNVF